MIKTMQNCLKLMLSLIFLDGTCAPDLKGCPAGNWGDEKWNFALFEKFYFVKSPGNPGACTC